MWRLPPQFSLHSFFIQWFLHRLHHFVRRWWWHATPASSNIRMHWMAMRVVSMVHGMHCWIHFRFISIHSMA